MRGKILQYNGSDGSGVVVADGQQHRFTIASWQGDVAPAVGKTVEVVLADGTVQTVMTVGDDVLMREKTAEFTQKLGGMMGGVAKSGVGGAIMERYGTPLLVAYGLFFVGSLFFNFLVMQMFGVTQGQPLFDLASGLSQAGGGGSGIKLLVLLSYASIAVPFFVRDRRAWLVLALPALTVVWALFTVRRALGPMAELFSYGLGLYVTLAAGIVLAVIGVNRFRKGT